MRSCLFSFEFVKLLNLNRLCLSEAENRDVKFSILSTHVILWKHLDALSVKNGILCPRSLYPFEYVFLKYQPIYSFLLIVLLRNMYVFIWLCHVLKWFWHAGSALQHEGSSVATCGIYFLDQGSNLSSLRWVCRVLATERESLFLTKALAEKDWLDIWLEYMVVCTIFS